MVLQGWGRGQVELVPLGKVGREPSSPPTESQQEAIREKISCGDAGTPTCAQLAPTLGAILVRGNLIK